MDCNLQNRPNVRARNSIFDDVKDNLWLYRWLQIHSFILLIKNFFRPLQKQDMFNLKQEFWPESTYINYGRYKNMHPNITASSIITKMIQVDIVIAGILAFFEAGTNFAGPIILKYILIYLNNKNASSKDTNLAFGLGGLWLGLALIEIYLKEYWLRLAGLAAVKTEVTLESQIYRKTIRVSSTYRKYITLGDFYSYWLVDVSIISTCINNLPNIINAPTTLILSVIFVCMEVGPYGLLLLLVIVIAIIIEVMIDLTMTNIYTLKLTKYDFKLTENMHMYRNLKNLKYLGWEELLMRENVRLRAPENVYNKMYYILGQIYLFVTNFAPVLVIFVLLLVGLEGDSNVWGSTVVFTVIGYIGTISVPLKNLPKIIGMIFQTNRVFRRLENFLEADEMVRCMDIYLEDGSVEVDGLILSVGSRRSIDRLIVRESIFIAAEDSMLSHMKSLPIEVRLFHTLDFLNEEEIKKFRKMMVCVEIPWKLTFQKGDRLVLLSSKSGSGKTSFIKAFLGNLNIQKGSFKYAGKMSFVSGNDFFLTKSIRQNVLFGEPSDEDALQRAYTLSGLSTQIPKFTEGDKTLVQNISNIISASQKVLISLARAIYYSFDILLMDDVFSEFEIDETCGIYNKICAAFADKLLIVTANTPNFLRDSDKVMILERRKAVEYGTFAQLKDNPKSIIHSFRSNDLKLQHYKQIICSKTRGLGSTEVEKVGLQPDESQGLLTPTEKKILTNNVYSTILNPSSYYNFIEQEKPEPPLPRTPQPTKRPNKVDFKYFYMLVRNGGLYYIFTFIFIALACGVQTFSVWLIGSLKVSPFGLSVGNVLLVYACLQIIFGILLLIYGVFTPRVATTNIEAISSEFKTIMSKTKIQEFQKFSHVHLTYVFGGDNQNFYNILDNINTVLFNFISMISTIIIMGLASYYIWIVAAVVLVYEVGVYISYRLAAHEVFCLGAEPKKLFFRALEDSVAGSDNFQYFDKVQWFQMKFFDGVYIFNGVWRTNLKFLMHAFNILSGYGELILMAGIIFLAISKKSIYTTQEAVYVNVALSFAPRIMGNIFTIVNNMAQMANQTNISIKIPFEILKGKEVTRYDLPMKPSKWPWTGRIQFRGVTVERKESKCPLLDNLNLTIKSGEIVAIYGDYDIDISILFMLMNGLISPCKNSGEYAGEVLISGVNIEQIGQIYVKESVLLLPSVPVCLTGTVRFNVDPFNLYTDEEVIDALVLVKFWDELKEEYENERMIQDFQTIEFVIEARGEQLTMAAVQKLNLARAILKKPKILLLERALSKLEVSKSQEFYLLIRSIFRNCTIVMITLDLHYLLRCDRVIYFKKGKIYEEGRPDDLALNPNSRLYQMIRCLADANIRSKDG